MVELLKRLRPDLDLTETLADITAIFPIAEAEREGTAISAKTRIDDVSELRAAFEEREISGNTVELIEGDTPVSIEKPGEEEAEHRISAGHFAGFLTEEYAPIVEAEMPLGEDKPGGEEAEQEMVIEEVVIPLTEDRREDIVDLTEEEEVRAERTEAGEPDISGQEESQPKPTVSTYVRRRRLILEDEEDEEEEEEAQQFPLLGEEPNREKLRREAAIAYGARPFEEPVDTRTRSERKRKGKDIAETSTKKAKRASSTVVIREPQEGQAENQQSEASSG